MEWWGAPTSYKWSFDWEYRLYMWNCPVPCLITGRYHGDTMGIFHWDIFTEFVGNNHQGCSNLYQSWTYVFLLVYLSCSPRWKQPCKNKGFRLLTKTYVLIIQYVGYSSENCCLAVWYGDLPPKTADTPTIWSPESQFEGLQIAALWHSMVLQTSAVVQSAPSAFWSSFESTGRFLSFPSRWQKNGDKRKDYARLCVNKFHSHPHPQPQPLSELSLCASIYVSIYL